MWKKAKTVVFRRIAILRRWGGDHQIYRLPEQGQVVSNSTLRRFSFSAQIWHRPEGQSATPPGEQTNSIAHESLQGPCRRPAHLRFGVAQTGGQTAQHRLGRRRSSQLA
ncbi:MAG TPA: hypothetical protein VI136_27120 [Verrucomicrobiae bacterium]